MPTGTSVSNRKQQMTSLERQPEIVRRWCAGEPVKAIATHFKVSQRTVWSDINRAFEAGYKVSGETYNREIAQVLQRNNYTWIEANKQWEKSVQKGKPNPDWLLIMDKCNQTAMKLMRIGRVELPEDGEDAPQLVPIVIDSPEQILSFEEFTKAKAAS